MLHLHNPEFASNNISINVLHLHKLQSFKINQKQLNVKVSEQGLYQCFGRIQGQHPIFIPKRVSTSRKIVEEAHILTIHGEVTLKMTKIRSEC